jgi:hypothetical protein
MGRASITVHLGRVRLLAGLGVKVSFRSRPGQNALVSTRVLILLCAVVGIAILAAGAAQVLLAR